MGQNFEIFFWFGLGLRYIMVCDVGLVFPEVRKVMLIKELAPPVGLGRKVKKWIEIARTL